MLTTALLQTALLSSVTASAQQEIKLTVNNIPNDKGTILIATKSGQWAKAKAQKGKIETILHDVPEGKGTIYDSTTRTTTRNSTKRTTSQKSIVPSAITK